jgi:hypothetical protein
MKPLTDIGILLSEAGKGQSGSNASVSNSAGINFDDVCKEICGANACSPTSSLLHQSA